MAADQSELAYPNGQPLMLVPAWVWDPTTTFRARGFATADLLVFRGQLIVQPRKIAVRIAQVPRIEYSWPGLVVQHLVWSYRLNLPGLASVLLDFKGRLASASVPFGMRKSFARTLEQAGFDVVEVVNRGWEAPAPVNRCDYQRLEGRVPKCVLASRSSR